MSDHNIDIIIRARDQASKAIGSVNRELGKMGSIASRGVRTAVGNLARLGAVAAGVGVGIGVLAVKSGIESLATLENATTSVTGAIKTMGIAGQVTSAQIAGWANEIEANIGAAFDDKDITAATATLIRYGKLAPKNIKPAMVVMTDLAAKTGSVSSASTLLARALADPTKAAGKLARAGIILTKGEQKQIAALVKAGKATEAQDFLLQKLTATTKGAAAATQGPYQRALSTLGDVAEDAERALAIGFLPVIEKTAKWLSTELADPKVIKNIQDFGQGLAGAFDDALTFARSIPWGTVVDGLQRAAGFAKSLFDAFRSMPPEVQTTLVALAGLNKLSGGAITGIVGELGKGLIKGVLGMTAGVVNINAGVVNGAGGNGAGNLLEGAAAAAGGSAIATVFVAGLSAAVFAGLGVALIDAMTNHPGANGALAKDDNGNIKPGQVFSTQHGFGRPPDQRAAPTRDMDKSLNNLKQSQDGTKAATRDMDKNLGSGISDTKSAVSTSGSLTSSAVTTGTSGTTSSVNVMGSRIVAAVAAAARSVPIVNVNVSPTTITNTTVINQRAGTTSGSRGSTNDRGK